MDTVPVGPARDVEFETGYGADDDAMVELKPPEAVVGTYGTELLLRIPPEMLELRMTLPVPVTDDNVEFAVGNGAEPELELLNKDETPPELDVELVGNGGSVELDWDELNDAPEEYTDDIPVWTIELDFIVEWW